jgi:hypothetical protein
MNGRRLAALFAAAIALLVPGCASHDQRRFGPFEAHATGVDGPIVINIVARDRPTNREVSEIIGSVTYCAQTWSTDFGRNLGPFDLDVLLDSEDFSMPVMGTNGERLIGWTSGSLTIVIAGPLRNMPPLYHELVHRSGVTGRSGDPGHLDLRWPMWNARGEQVASESVERR